MRTCVALFAAAVTLVVSPSCRGDVLFDTIGGGPLTGWAGYAAVEYTSPPAGASTNYLAVPLTVPVGGWTVQRVELAMGASVTVPAELPIPSAGVGRLFFFPRTGETPTSTDNPQMGSLVQYTFEPLENRTGIVTIDDAGITLAAGDYWLGFAIVTDDQTGFFSPRWIFRNRPLTAAGQASAWASVDGDTPLWSTVNWVGGQTNYTAEFMLRLSGNVPSPGGATALACFAVAAVPRRIRR